MSLQKRRLVRRLLVRFLAEVKLALLDLEQLRLVSVARKRLLVLFLVGVVPSLFHFLVGAGLGLFLAGGKFIPLALEKPIDIEWLKEIVSLTGEDSLHLCTAVSAALRHLFDVLGTGGLLLGSKHFAGVIFATFGYTKQIIQGNSIIEVFFARNVCLSGITRLFYRENVRQSADATVSHVLLSAMLRSF